MKSYVILFVALSMLVKPLWPVVEYAMNYDYIVTVLCENKEKPQLQCDGKCYLAKQLAKASEQSDKDPFGENRSKIRTQYPVFFQPLRPIHLTTAFLLAPQDNFKGGPVLISTLFTSDISEPPELG